jgi:hypothetical protein
MIVLRHKPIYSKQKTMHLESTFVAKLSIRKCILQQTQNENYQSENMFAANRKIVVNT